MDTVKSWMDVEEIRKLAADLLKDPSDLEVLKKETVEAGESEMKDRAIKAIAEAAKRLNVEVKKAQEATQSIKLPDSVPAPVKMEPMPEKLLVPASRPVSELLKPSGDTEPLDLRTPVVSKTKLPSSTELQRVMGRVPKASAVDSEFAEFVQFATTNQKAEGLFIFDRDDDVYVDTIENDKFMEVSLSLLPNDRSTMPKSLYLRLAAERYLQLAGVDTKRGHFVIGYLVQKILIAADLESLDKEFQKIANP